jgi:NhaP-type Na+/H+ or K+/H+ antiporter
MTLLAFDQLQGAGPRIGTVVSVATLTIGVSVLAHGLSAQPIAAWYARRLKAADTRAFELVDVPEVPERHTILGGPLRQ